MKIADKNAWTTALRSDEYTQGTGRLAYIEVEGGIEKHCCLGVLSEISGAQKVPYEVYDGMQRFLFDDALAVLPLTIAKKVGLGEKDPVIDFGVSMKGTDGHELTLSELNDFGFTFKQIADIIDYFIPAE